MASATQNVKFGAGLVLKMNTSINGIANMGRV
jgi:hypothetical protein